MSSVSPINRDHFQPNLFIRSFLLTAPNVIGTQFMCLINIHSLAIYHDIAHSTFTQVIEKQRKDKKLKIYN
jgi:hypothetical protein